MFVHTFKIFPPVVGVKQFCTTILMFVPLSHTGGKTNVSEYTKFGYNYVTA